MSEEQEPSEEHFDFDDDFPPPKGGALKVVIILGIIGAGGFGLLSALKGDGQGTGEFSIEDQVAELSQLIGDKSCTNAQTLFDKLMKRELNPLERRMVQKREKAIKKCLATAAAREAREAPLDPAVAAAIAKSLVFVSKQEKHFSKPESFMDRLTLTVEDVRAEKGDDGEIRVAVQLTLRPKATMLFDENSFRLFDNNDALDEARWFRPVDKDADTIFMPRMGAGQMERGRSVTGWITFGGLDDQVKHLGLQYRPVWAGADPFVVGLAADMRLKTP
ncbi:MAG: hypothetical protein VX405_11510 [Myxococcota bacterium]|nr:hypothetical protein [Myxococcota bacterium]